MVMQRIVKAKNQRVKRALTKREPKLIENDKQTMIIKGGNTSEIVTSCLKDIHTLKKPNSIMYKKKNIMRPFEDDTSLEFFSEKSDASLCLFGSHNKKRPNNMVFARFFDGHILDMLELGIISFKSIADFKADKCPEGTKPCLIFTGDAFEHDEDLRRLKSVFIDFFRGPVVKNIRLSGLEHILQFTAANGRIYFKSYKSILKKSGSKTPRVELQELGPAITMEMRRSKLASRDLYRRSLKTPKAAKIGKKKNVSMDVFGSKLGRVHMERQDYAKLSTRRIKGLKKSVGEKRSAKEKATKIAEKRSKT